MSFDIVNASIEFEPIRKIGVSEGRNSSVYLAKDLQLDGEFVVKEVKESTIKKNRQDYFQEARILYSNRHVNIMPIQYACKRGDSIYFAMPYYKNGSLASIMDKRYLTVGEIIKYSLDILTGLNYIHSNGFVHLDLKPSNILIDDTGRAVITDFGLSQSLDENGLTKQNMVYEKVYQEPEMFIINKRTIYSDIYQFGITLYRMCNGINILRKQFIENIGDMGKLDEFIKKGLIPNRNYYLPHLPDKLVKVVKKCISVDPRKRYDNVIDIMNDLSDIEENLNWRFTNKDDERYVSRGCNFEYSIKVVSKGDNADIDIYRKNIHTGKSNKLNKLSAKNIPRDDILNQELKKVFKSIK